MLIDNHLLFIRSLHHGSERWVVVDYYTAGWWRRRLPSRVRNWFKNEVQKYAWGAEWSVKTGHYSQVRQFHLNLIWCDVNRVSDKGRFFYLAFSLFFIILTWVLLKRLKGFSFPPKKIIFSLAAASHWLRWKFSERKL